MPDNVEEIVLPDAITSDEDDRAARNAVSEILQLLASLPNEKQFPEKIRHVIDPSPLGFLSLKQSHVTDQRSAEIRKVYEAIQGFVRGHANRAGGFEQGPYNNICRPIDQLVKALQNIERRESTKQNQPDLFQREVRLSRSVVSGALVC